MNNEQSSIPTCGQCASWQDGQCHCEDAITAFTLREADAPACANYISFHKMSLHNNSAWHWITHHVKSSLAIAVIILVFLGIWLVTGDIWAAIIIVEILFEILGGL